MLKHKITYENFDGEELTEEFYFNLTKTEMVELEVEHKEGMQEWLDRIIKTEDRQLMIAEFKRIILLSYGEKSPDGKLFVKNDQIRESFSHHAAYHTLFMQLATEDEAAANFIKGILPKDLAKEVDKVNEETKTMLSPPTN